MASSSPWIAMRDTAVRTSNSPLSSSYSYSITSSIVRPFRLIRNNRNLLVTSSLQTSSSSSSAAIDAAITNTGKKARRTITSLEVEGNSESKASESRSHFQLRPIQSFKTLFGTRSLWRRTLFGSKKVRSIILLNLLTIIYASDIPVVKEVEAIMDPAAFTVVRFAVSALPFVPFVFQTWGDVPTRNAGIELGFWVSLGYLMQAIGLLASDAGRASFISMFTVIVVPMLDGMLGAIIPARTWFGALMSVVGVAMLESTGSPPNVGDLLNFLSAIFFGIHMLRTEHISRCTKTEKFLPLLSYEVCVIAFLSTLWYFLGAWFGGIEESPSSWTWTLIWDWMAAFPWIPALYTGVFSTGLCLWVEMAAMRDVSATETAIIYGLEPVWGAGFAWFLLGERWGMTGWIGAVFVLGGSLMVQLYGSSSSSCLLVEDGETKHGNHSLASDKRSHFSTSPVVVSSRKDVSDLFKK